MSSVGLDVSRADGPAKIRGAAQYTADVELPGMVYAKALRSTYPHARLVRVDAEQGGEAARRRGGVNARRFERKERLFWTGGKRSAGVGHRSGPICRRGDRGGGGRGARYCRGGAGFDRSRI